MSAGFSDPIAQMHAAALVFDRDRVCIEVIGPFGALLSVPEDWDPIGDRIEEIISFFANRGDYGPRIPSKQHVTADLFLAPEFEEIYLDTPTDTIIGVTVKPSRAPVPSCVSGP